MKSGSVKILAVIVVVLFGMLYALNTARRSQPDEENELLVPELKARLNDLETVAITDTDDQLTIVREEDAWRVRDKDGYPANTATLRQLLLAIADARKIERKTANPELYDRLGVQHPAEDGGNGVLVEASGPDFGFSLILGEAAQGDYRYARIPAEKQSWLIDGNPDVPEDAAGWLEADIVDVGTTDVRSVEIRHADGETIRMHKETSESGTFTVEGIPEGRELSYPTVVNSIAGALGNLTLEDVAKADADDPTPTANVVFTTFDGLQVEVTTADIDEATWIALDAAVVANDAAGRETPADRAAGDEAAEATDAEQNPAGDADSESEPAAGEDVEPEAEDEPTPAERAATINERTDGWRYRIAGYKADQLTRRWEDLLKAETEE